jgi:hypothetical protein
MLLFRPYIRPPPLPPSPLTPPIQALIATGLEGMGEGAVLKAVFLLVATGGGGGGEELWLWERAGLEAIFSST